MHVNRRAQPANRLVVGEREDHVRIGSLLGRGPPKGDVPEPRSACCISGSRSGSGPISLSKLPTRAGSTSPPKTFAGPSIAAPALLTR